VILRFCTNRQSNSGTAHGPRPVDIPDGLMSQLATLAPSLPLPRASSLPRRPAAYSQSPRRPIFPASGGVLTPGGRRLHRRSHELTRTAGPRQRAHAHGSSREPASPAVPASQAASPPSPSPSCLGLPPVLTPPTGHFPSCPFPNPVPSTRTPLAPLPSPRRRRRSDPIRSDPFVLVLQQE